MTRLFASLTALVALSAVAQDAPKQRLTVIPFASLTGDVPARAGTKALGMLNTEFKSADSFTLVDAKKAAGNAAAETELENARKEVGTAQDLRGKKKFRLAEESLTRAIASYTKAIGAITDVGEVADAYALLSAVQFNTGRDDEGAKSLRQALTLAPDRELPLAATSAMFSRVVSEARTGLKKGAKGTLLLESSPSNAPVLLDGLALGATPLSVTDVPPGTHFWRATLPSGEVVAGTVEVTAGKQAKATASSASKDPETRVLTALAQNKVDKELVDAAKEQAKTVETDFLVFGALSKEGKSLKLDSFLYTVATGDLRRMARTEFDTELLSAGMQFYNLAGELSKKGSQVGEAVRVPEPVSISLVASAAKQSEAKYGVVPGTELSTETGDTDVKDDGNRKPVEPKRRVPLQKKP